MKKIRIGKDITIKWAVLTNGQEVDLQGRDLRLELTDARMVRFPLKFTTDGNTLTAVYKGSLQRNIGEVRLTLWENCGKDGQTALDACSPFELVKTTCEEEGADEGLSTETIQLSGDIEVSSSGIILPDAPNDGGMYVRQNGGWVKLEKQDLSDYVTTEELTEELQQYATKEELGDIDTILDEINGEVI